MRTVAVATALVILTISGTAQARARGADWDGAYAGLELGYGTGSAKQLMGNVGGPLNSTVGSVNQDGGLIGGYVGYNWLFAPRWVLGPEVNLAWTDIGTSSSSAAINPVNQRWEGSLRGRLGFLMTPSVLLYTTAGYSLLEGSLKALKPPVEEQSETFGGWTVGVGSEWEINSDMLFRLQYRYTDYGTQGGSFPLHGYEFGASPIINTVSVGVTFRF